MVNWKELGEIPDSEDEDGFDSQELAIPMPDLSSLTALETDDNELNKDPAAPETEPAEDIWDVPDSQETNRPNRPKQVTPRPPTSRSRPLKALPPDASPSVSPSSSPLSPARSDVGLPPADIFALPESQTASLDSQLPSESQHRTVGNEKVSRSYIELSSPPRSSEKVAISARPTPSSTVARLIPIQSQELGHDDEHLAARQASVRYQRSLRPRKPIQEHPYLLENAHYSNLLRQNGVRPLRMAIEAERRRQQQASSQEQDEDFQDDSQESRVPGISDENQLNGLQDFLDGMDSLMVPSPSPPKTSPLNDRAGPSSQASSLGDTDTTSLAGEDLPELADLIKKNHQLSSKKALKRKSSPPSTARKRKRYDIVDNDPLEPAAILRLGAHSVDSPAAARSLRRSPERRETIVRNADTPREASPTQAVEAADSLPSPVPAAASWPRPVLIESDSEDELAHDPISEPEEEGSASESEPESGSELVHTVGRRIKGVLPASWLRLDQQAARLKTQKEQQRQHHDRSPEREPRRGVAQRRQATPRASTAPHLLFEDSDDDTPAQQQPTTDEVFNNQTRLVLEPSAPSTAPNVPEDSWSDGGSVVEDNWIDPMTSGRKRQLKLSESFAGTSKRPKTSSKPRKIPSYKPPGQMRITSMLDQPQTSLSSAKDLIKKKYRQPSSGRKSKSSTKRQPRSRKSSTVAPRLSILDVIQPGAPRFLKIAARSAKRRQDMGRSSPARKLIQLATREDHLDAVSVLNQWRAGSISQRASVTAARKQKKSRPRPPKGPLSETSPNASTSRRSTQQPSSTSARRLLVRQITRGGTVSYQSKGTSQPVAKQRPRASKPLARTGSGAARPAQLEMDETDQTRSAKFGATKRQLDRLYRKQREDFSNSSTLAFNETAADAEYPASPPPEENPVPLRIVRLQQLDKQKSRYRKKTKPQQLDIEAPQYARANDPIPVEISPAPESISPDTEGGLLRGLGPYGTEYTHHFEAFPLDSHVYFHESTLIGSEVLESIVSPAYSERFQDERPRSAFNFGDQTMRWGSWDAQVSSELGVVLDFIAEQLEHPPPTDSPVPGYSALSAAAFVMKFTTDSLSLPIETSAKSFVSRMLEVLRGFDGRLQPLVRQNTAGSGPRGGLVAQVYDHLLVTAFLVLSLCRHDDTLMSEQFQTEDLLKDMAKTSILSLLTVGLDPVRDTYQQLRNSRFRERGLRDDVTMVHSWVLVRMILEHARIPRASFWDITYVVMAPPEAVDSLDAKDHERIWKNMFTLLPLTEFNGRGLLIAGSRHDTSIDGWSLPQKLLKKVFQLYQENKRQSPSFNNYCRALVGRCHYLVQQWGWRRCVPVIGVIFDFFGSQNLAHLRNEEVFRSPKFLEELGGKPSLNVDKGDRCFHIFLKLVALSIQKLKSTESLKDIRNLIARTMPNHNRQHLKEQGVHERDLAALRNHHDLLCTLFWASPPDLRPGAQLIERLVAPASSHKEACLVNTRAWNQLARFVVASGEATTSFKPFAQWRNGFFQSIMQQFDSVASDMQQQVLALSKNTSNKIDPDMVNAMVAANRTAVMDVIHASNAASLDIMRHTPDLEAATFALNTLQLQQVFKHFAVYPPEFDWSILQASLSTVEVFLSRIDDFKENHESQESESQILNSEQANDAILVLDHDLANGFFSMARAVISAGTDRDLSASAAVDKFRCTEMVVTLSARLGIMFMNGGLMRLVDMFKFGEYGLFEHVPAKMSLDERRYLALFLTTLLKHGFDDFKDAGFTLSEAWMLSIVKPRSYLAYENQLAQELQRLGKEFVPEAAVGLAINPAYISNRDMFESGISWMRKSLRDAGPALKKMLLAEYAKTLKAVMQQIKGDLRTICSDTTEHPNYVSFVRDIIALIRAHGPDICAVDDFFYQINKEYSPSVEDPQLQVAGMLSYGLRLGEGDTKFRHQLFFFLFNNFKMSLINDKLHEALKMLYAGMRNDAILTFILNKMIPAIVLAAFTEDNAFPLLEVYVEALRNFVTRNVVPYEFKEKDLLHLLDIFKAVIIGFGKLQASTQPWTLAQVDVLRQVLSMLNVLWPAIRAEWSRKPSLQTWRDVREALKFLNYCVGGMEEYLAGMLEQRAGDLKGRFLGVVTPAARELTELDTHVKNFTDNIVNDVRRNWVFSGGKIMIQAPGKGRGMPSTQSGQGVDGPHWDSQSVREELYEETKEWHAWYRRTFEGPSRISGYVTTFLF